MATVFDKFTDEINTKLTSLEASTQEKLAYVHEKLEQQLLLTCYAQTHIMLKLQDD